MNHWFDNAGPDATCQQVPSISYQRFSRDLVNGTVNGEFRQNLFQYVRKFHKARGRELFETDALRNPGFIEEKMLSSSPLRAGGYAARVRSAIGQNPREPKVRPLFFRNNNRTGHKRSPL